MPGCMLVDTPMDRIRVTSQKELTKQDKSCGQGMYHRLLKLIYLSQIPPDIALAVSVVSHFLHQACEEYAEVVYHILKYSKIEDQHLAIVLLFEETQSNERARNKT